ncbi:MAG: hypothetical protein CFE24_10460 [Flavobacterium sp. BFFFF2]|nr:MAG: hypothetical protein CFE24_10460 [Flavobacterium sp. BFFFF2]
MKSYLLLFVLIGTLGTLSAQPIKDSISNPSTITEIDTLTMPPIQLEEVFVYKVKVSAESKKEFQLLQNRVYRVYPYARVAADRLTGLNKNLSRLTSNRDKRKYFKLVENYLETEFSDQLKKLSRKQGQILVKLIHRQTGFTTFDLIKEYKSGWKAFWSNTTARMFDINLKTPYDPTEVNEDFLIETILERAFSNGRLTRQKPAHPVDLDQLTDMWREKAIAQAKEKKE